MKSAHSLAPTRIPCNIDSSLLLHNKRDKPPGDACASSPGEPIDIHARNLIGSTRSGINLCELLYLRLIRQDRARHNRSLGKGKRKLLDRMRAQPARADVMVPVQRLPAPNSTRGQKTSAKREARNASCAVRWATLAVPLPVGNPEQALEVVGFYLLRWRIEDWHRIRKTGCEVEKISHRTASRIQRAVAIKAVIAWRLAVFALLGRETPELDAGLLFSEHEIAILEDYAHERRVQGPDNLGRAVLLSMMGGYLNRKHDAPPGHQIVWEGYARLALGARVVERAQKFGSDSSVFRKLTSG